MSSKSQSEAWAALDQHLAKEISGNMGADYAAAKGALDRHVEAAANGTLPAYNNTKPFEPIERKLDIRLGFELGL